MLKNTPSLAYDSGFLSGMNFAWGEPRVTNPYEIDGDDYLDWELGFADGQFAADLGFDDNANA